MRIDDFFLCDWQYPHVKNGYYNFPLLKDWEELEKIPELEALKECPQHTYWHQEGDVWTHTKNCIEALHTFARNHAYMVISRELVLATLLHDIGKPKVTRKNEVTGEWDAPRHGIEGARMVRQLLCDEKDMERREKVCALVRDHMLYHNCTDENGDIIPSQIYRTNHSYANPIDFLILNYADDFGSTNEQTETFRYARLRKIEDYIKANKLDSPKCFRTSVEKLSAMRPGMEVAGEPNPNPGFTMAIFVGLPGSGKDTLFDKAYSYRGYKMVGRDEIRRQLGIIGKDGKKALGNKETESEIGRVLDSQIREHCLNRQSFVVNSTNLNYFARQHLVEMVLTDPVLPKPFIEIVVFDTPFETCWERREGEIPLGDMELMRQSLDFPMPYEANRIFVCKDGILKLFWDDRYRCVDGFYNTREWFGRLFGGKHWWNKAANWIRTNMTKK